MKKNKKFKHTLKNCWICKLNGRRVSDKLENKIMELCARNGAWFNALSDLSEFLVGDEESDKIYNNLPKDWLQRPSEWAKKLMIKIGLNRR